QGWRAVDTQGTAGGGGAQVCGGDVAIVRTAARLSTPRPALAAVRSSPYLGRVTHLRLEGEGRGPEEAGALAGGAGLRHLQQLWRFDNQVGDAGAVALARAPPQGRLESLAVQLVPGRLADAGQQGAEQQAVRKRQVQATADAVARQSRGASLGDAADRRRRQPIQDAKKDAFLLGLHEGAEPEAFCWGDANLQCRAGRWPATGWRSGSI